MQSIIITGGCGFIGINLIYRLLREKNDHRLRVVDNLSAGKREDLASVAEFEEITQEKIEGAFNHKLELVIGDVRDEDLAGVVCRGADAVVHLAANTGVIPSIENPREDCTANVIGTFNYLEAARTNASVIGENGLHGAGGVGCFVFASSGAPLGEQDPPIHEDMVPRPISPYGASKLAGEGYCKAYHGSFGLNTVALRFGNVYGPHSGHKNSVVAKFIKHILSSESLPIYGDGTQTRDFIYVDDLIQAILLGMERPNIGGHIFQIATHKEHTVAEVAEELNLLAEKYLGHKSPIIYEKERKGEVRRNYSDITKAKKMLGFEPKYDLKKGLEETFLWFLRGRE